MSPHPPAAMTAEEFVRLLAAAGVSQSEFARKLGMKSSRTVNRWATGASRIDQFKAERIRRMLRAK